jgi:hypothetical protein
MRGLYGVANHNPHAVATLLQSLGYKPKLLGFGETSLTGADVYLVPSVSQFLRHREALNKKRCKAVVFDSPVLLEYLKPIVMLDVGKKRASYLYSFTPLDRNHVKEVFETDEKISVSHETVEVIPTILNAVTVSALNPILNFLYSVTNSDSRFKYQAIIYEWIASEDSIKLLKQRLLKLMRKKEPTATMKTLCAYFSSTQGLNIRRAVIEILSLRQSKKPVNYKALYKKYQVEPFDVKYLIRAIRKQKNVKIGIDQTLNGIHQTRKVERATV